MRPHILVVDSAEPARTETVAGLRAAGFDVSQAATGAAALEQLSAYRPHAVVCDVVLVDMDGTDLLHDIRSRPALRETPIIVVTGRADITDLEVAMELGADDFVAKPFEMRELVARIQAKLSRPPMPAELHPVERSTGAMNPRAFDIELAREVGRVGRGGRPGVLARLDVHEAESLRVRLGSGAQVQVWREIVDIAAGCLRPLDVIGKSGEGGLSILLPETTVDEARTLLRQLGREVTVHELPTASDIVRVTPVIGYAAFDSVDAARLEGRADAALGEAATHLDLEPVAWHSGLEAQPAAQRTWLWRWLSALVLPAQLIGLAVLVWLLPFAIYVVTDHFGFSIVPVVYIAVVLILLVTAILIWIECGLAMRTAHPPPFEGRYPPAAAIIAAYLPNEAATVVDTVYAFLEVRYPGQFEIVLAYNTPRPLPVEQTLREIAAAYPRLRLVSVPNSTSKAQNVNYALDHTEAEMIGIFDADHHPDPDAFARAWQWLAAGNDIVQGHNVVRNGDQSWVTRTVAVEFELIYAVAHPGRARLHGFGIFGGSNGFWRADVLRQTRMHGAMLTEDIDSSMRVLQRSGKIVSDPLLVSRELAPVTLKALWNQRLRWAQGWFEVSVRHALALVFSPRLSLRQRLGAGYLTLWREFYPWVSLQIYPIIAFWIWKSGSVSTVDWFVPIFVITTVFTICTGPTQAGAAYLLGHPDIRRHKGWFWAYAILSVIFYTPFKDVVSMVAQVRHVRGERKWRVTPR